MQIGKYITAHASWAAPGTPTLIGIGLDSGECEGCGNKYTTIEIGLLFIVFAIVFHSHAG